MKQIKASEVKPGMTIRWDSGGITYQCKVGGLFPSITSGLVSVEAAGGGYIPLSRTQPVTVLSEPAPPQPEEPTEFGIMVTVYGCPAVRVNTRSSETGIWALEPVGQEPLLKTWAELLELGDVEIPDQGWTVPDDGPEVPDRIEEWPEDDTKLRKHKWRDAVGDVWVPVDDRWGWGDNPWGSHDRPVCGPWTRVTDA